MRQIIKQHFDFVVAGGGMAGLGAAVSAARCGVKTALVQNRPVLGGNSSSEVRVHIVGADSHGGRKDARESGLLEYLRLENHYRNPQRCHSLWDLLLWETVKAEPNITLLLNTQVVGVVMSGPDRIESVEAIQVSTEKAFRLHAPLFADCTGDGRLGFEAGADFRQGREAKAEYGETWAMDEADDKSLGSSLMFVGRKHDRPMPFTRPSWAYHFPDCDSLPHRHAVHPDHGYWWIEWGGEKDTIQDNEEIRDELTRFLFGAWDHLKNHPAHREQNANWALEWVGVVPGKRAGRRFLGPVVLTEQHLVSTRVWEDAVAYGGWSIDLHPPDGMWSKEPPSKHWHVKDVYGIPLRALYSRNVHNLFFAGRCISATHVAYGSTRVMGTACVMGQGVGTAAARCLADGCQPRDLSPEQIQGIQQSLLRQDCYVPGVPSGDTDDFARTARVTASSHAPGNAPANVVDGITRPVHEETHRWMSDPSERLPQWLELAWEQAVKIGAVVLTFDSDLSLPLTLSHADSIHRKLPEGAMPPLVRDYRVLARHDGGEWETLAEANGNYQRRREHRFEQRSVTALRLEVTVTNGASEAHVFEVRAYAEAPGDLPKGG